MRPLKIKIAGFGTYCKPTEIDLEQLGKSGLYLITGDTGSGKTTIFDAITFALYGEASGANRDSSMLRSTYANEEDVTEVDLTFEQNGKIYNIKRNPSYTRKSKKGDSTVTQNPDATLTFPDGNVITKPKAVTEAVIDLIGIDKNQFCQIAMISQGEFQKLLTEGTESRQKIFRKLFKTDKFQVLQEKLKEEERFYFNKVNEKILFVNNCFNNISCNEDSVLTVDLRKAKETDMPLVEKLEIVEKILKEDESENKKIEKNLSENQKEIEVLTEKLLKAEQYKQTLQLLKETESELEADKIKVVECEKILQQEVLNSKETEKKEKELILLSKELSKYDEFLETQNKVFACEKELKSSQIKKESSEEKAGSYQKEEKTLQEELKKLEKCETVLVKLNSEKEDIENQIDNITELKSLLSNLTNKKTLLQNKQKEFLQAYEKSENVKKDFEEKNKAYLFEQAGILAENLQENEECPVCGSTHHPHLAKKSENAPSKEELELLKKDVASAEKNAMEKQNAATELKAGVTAEEKNVEKLANQIFKMSISFSQDSDSEISLLNKKCEEELESEKNKKCKLENQIRVEEKNKQRKLEIEEKLPLLKNNLESENENVKQFEILIAQKITEKKAIEENLESLKKDLKFESKTLAQNAVNSLEKEITDAKKRKESAENNFNAEKSKINILEGKLSQLKTQLENCEKADDENLEEKKEKLNAERETLLQKNKVLSARIITNSNELKKINQESEDLIQLQSKHSLVSGLSKTANGKIGGEKSKIMLETYIQTTYFDRILNFANARFLVMSDGQYELVRDKTVDKQSQSGLELNVLDHYNSTLRSVKSLSGGESFEASLSLALGLSDEIAHSAGGIKIDTMFVDEGFGSLDAETLQKAFKALSGISEGNKLVGIISHVDLLKEKIDKQIVVKKTRDQGSHVTMKL